MRILIVIIFLFFLTGCSPKVEIDTKTEWTIIEKNDATGILGVINTNYILKSDDGKRNSIYLLTKEGQIYMVGDRVKMIKRRTRARFI